MNSFESHSISSLSRRILTSREACRKLIESGVLTVLSKTDHGYGSSFVFHSSVLDLARQRTLAAVERSVARLNVSEQEKVLVRVHALRSLSKLEN